VNNQRIVLAFNGHPASCAAARWLTQQRVRLQADATNDVDVIALIVDVGQGDAPEELYGRALACGVRNAHVVDRCEEFARRAVVPAAAALATLDERALRQLTYPVIADALVEIARIECADAVAHASVDTTLDDEIHAACTRADLKVGPYHLRVLAPALKVGPYHLRVLAPARDGMPHASNGAVHPDRHLLMRRARTLGTPGTLDPATVTIGFEAGVPRSVNGVTMELPELIESLSLIGGHYHVDDENAAPALVLLQRAYRECGGDGAAALEIRLKSDTTTAVVHA
jgi:argininosuccinate synthase